MLNRIRDRETRKEIRKEIREEMKITTEKTINKARADSAYERFVENIREKDAIPPELYVENDVKRGLRNSNGTGVVVGMTRIGEVQGYGVDERGRKIPTEGKLYYRGYDVEDLVSSIIKENRFGFEEITYLLMIGSLPTENELQKFNEFLGNHRELPRGFATDMILTAPSNNIMNKLARSVLALYSYDDNPDDTSPENILRQSISLVGYFPAIISYAYQAKSSFYDNKSLHLHPPIKELSTSENILRMLRPTGEYTDLEAKILDISMIVHAEHGGGNNSSFTTQLVSSTGTDTYSAIAAAVGSLKGPRHGGANLAVINMMDNIKNNVHDIGDKSKLDEYLVKILQGKANDGSGLLYGIGHAIYTLSDPRAKLLKEMARKLAESRDLMESFELCEYIEQRGPELYAEVHGKKVLMPANVDLYSGFVYDALDIPIDIATPLFATARLSGWCAHRLEECISGGKLMRPAYLSAQDHLEYIPMDKRVPLI